MNNSDFILGSNVDAFENSINEFSGSAHTISTANGTDALILSLKYLRDKFPEKNEIITTPLSYLASTSSIILNRLKPVFADIDETLNIPRGSWKKNYRADIMYIIRSLQWKSFKSRKDNWFGR